MPDWLVSKTMRVLFSVSAWVVVCWGIFIVFGLIVWAQEAKSFETDNPIGVVLGSAFVVVSIFAILIISLGMAIHCLSNCDFSVGTKILWSILAFLTTPFGAAIYFFTVYKKQTKMRREVKIA